LNKSSTTADTKGGVLELVDLKLDPKGFEVSLKNDKLSLTRSEFLLLKSLMEEQGCVLTREDLISKVQGMEVNVTGRTIDTHVFGLRKKLKDYSSCIETIRGVGYRINQPEV
jgi:two-component system phosphate regulon response regulator PhoB